jgi:hypothetical protein
LWLLVAEAIARRHGGWVTLTYDPAVGGGARIELTGTKQPG